MERQIKDPYCQTCRTALNIRTTLGVVGYEHARDGFDDHKPEPVPLATIDKPRIFCDFCSAEDTPWVFPTATVTRHHRVGGTVSMDLGDYREHHNAARTRLRGGEDFKSDMGETWAACNECANLIVDRDMMGLIFRVTNALPAKLTRGNRLAGVRANLLAVYEELLSTIGNRQPNPHHRPYNV